MHKHIVSGVIILPEKKQQQQLFQQLDEFVNWMQKTKDADEIRKDKQKSVPIAMLPMVF